MRFFSASEPTPNELEATEQAPAPGVMSDLERLTERTRQLAAAGKRSALRTRAKLLAHASRSAKEAARRATDASRHALDATRRPDFIEDLEKDVDAAAAAVRRALPPMNAYREGALDGEDYEYGADPMIWTRTSAEALDAAPKIVKERKGWFFSAF